MKQAAIWIAIIVIVALIGWYVGVGLNNDQALPEEEASGEVQGDEDSVYDGTTGKDASADVNFEAGVE